MRCTRPGFGNIPRRRTRWCWIPETRSSSGTRAFSAASPFYARPRRRDVAVRESARRARAVALSPRRYYLRGGGVAAAATRLALHAVAATHSLSHAVAATHAATPPSSFVEGCGGVDGVAAGALADTHTQSQVSPRNTTQVRLARPEEAEKGPGPRERPLRLRGERPQDRRFVSVEPGLAEGVFPEHAERPVGAGAVLRKHDGFERCDVNVCRRHACGFR